MIPGDEHEDRGTRDLSAFVTELRHRVPDLDETVLDAFASVDRADFVPPGFDPYAVSSPVPLAEIGERTVSTISAPDMVALMLQQAQIRPGDRVLEVGAGSGYSAALMAAQGARVTSIEIVSELVEQARAHLRASGSSARVMVGDGMTGRPEDAPYDRVVFTCAARRLPAWVWTQTTDRARVVIPLQRLSTYCLALVRDGDVLTCVDAIPCGFVPLIGDSEDPGEADAASSEWPPHTLSRHPST